MWARDRKKTGHKGSELFVALERGKIGNRNLLNHGAYGRYALAIVYQAA